MNNHIKIDRMTAEDIAVYAQCFEVPDGAAWVLKLFKDFENDIHAYFFKAYLDDEFAGYCAIYRNTANTHHFCKIMDIEVMPIFRRKGVGKALMYKILDFSREFGLNRIKLEVDTKNITALEMYKSLGFQIEKTENEYYDDGGNAYIMWREESK